MDLTNRILILGGALLGIFVVIVIILLAWGAPEQSIERLNELATYMEDHNNNAAKLIITLGGLILVLLAAIVVIIEVAPPESGSLKVANVETGDARIPTEEVAHLLEEELSQLPQLNRVQARVEVRGDKAEVDLDLHVGADADLAATAEEACRRATDLLARRIGVALARPPRAELHYLELRLAGRHTASGSVSSSEIHPQAMGSEPSATLRAGSPPATTESTHEASERSPEDRPPGA